MLIGLMGYKGSGKSTVAKYLCESHGFIEIGLADPLKRFCMDVYGWTEEQLWGPSNIREMLDERYLTQKIVGDKTGAGFWMEKEYLTPRKALQTLGTEWGRSLYKDTWINYAMRVSALAIDGAKYDRVRGLYNADYYSGRVKHKHIVIPDVRFQNEVDAIVGECGLIWRLKGTSTSDKHPSETEQDDVVGAVSIDVPRGKDGMSEYIDKLLLENGFYK